MLPLKLLKIHLFWYWNYSNSLWNHLLTFKLILIINQENLLPTFEQFCTKNGTATFDFQHWPWFPPMMERKQIKIDLLSLFFNCDITRFHYKSSKYWLFKIYWYHRTILDECSPMFENQYSEYSLPDNGTIFSQCCD